MSGREKAILMLAAGALLGGAVGVPLIRYGEEFTWWSGFLGLLAVHVSSNLFDEARKAWSARHD